MHAYDEIYLDGAMIRMGDMLEYACLDCGYDPDSFWKMFLQSRIARHFETGDVSIIAGKSGPEIAHIVLEEVDFLKEFPQPMWRENRSDLFWSGWILAYYQWYTAYSFSKIWDSISIRMLQKLYPALHEADIKKAVEVLTNMQKPVEKTKIADLRAIKGMTQQELADQAHMSISQLQRLEYGERKIENLSLKTAISLANALGVSVEELK
jgi:DNA-binding XRE family transcriptional regulator